MFPKGAKVIIRIALLINVCKGFKAELLALPQAIIPYLTYELTRAWYTFTRVPVSTLCLSLARAPQDLDNLLLMYSI